VASHRSGDSLRVSDITAPAHFHVFDTSVLNSGSVTDPADAG
jgi:hypothetical protein